MSLDTGKYEIWELLPVDLTEFQRLDTEPLGSKRKFWFKFQDAPQPWLFKYARPNTGEHWSEKIAAEIAPLIGLPAAHVKLARFKGELGVACQSFVPYVSDPETRQSIKQGELVHDNEVLAGWVEEFTGNPGSSVPPARWNCYGGWPGKVPKSSSNGWTHCGWLRKSKLSTPLIGCRMNA